jgi:hypothetical protein
MRGARSPSEVFTTHQPGTKTHEPQPPTIPPCCRRAMVRVMPGFPAEEVQ